MEINKSIGSDPSNDIVIKNHEVAAFHAILTMKGQNFMEIEALESKGGVFVNNQKIQGKARLKANDIVSFGAYVFEFEMHYPEFLGSSKLTDDILDSGETLDPVEEEQDIASEQETTLHGMKGVKRWIYALQFPKDRQKMQRIWMLVISSVILLTFFLPYVSWYNDVARSFISVSETEKFSGVFFFFELLDVKVSDLPLLIVLGYVIVLLTLVGSVISAVLFFLFGIGVWRPKSFVLLKRWALAMLVLFGLVFLGELFRFLDYYLDGIDNFRYDSKESLWQLENLGIGFWMSLVGFVLIYRATRNGLWRPLLPRKWASLTFTFWLPFVIFLAISHQHVGLIETKVDTAAFKKQMGGYGGIFGTKKIEERYCQDAPLLAMSSYVFLIQKAEQNSASNRMRRRTADMPKKFKELQEKQDFYYSLLWLALHLLLVILVVQFFYRKMRGAVRLALAIATLGISIGLFLILTGIVGLSTSQAASAASFFQISVGYAAYIAVIGSLGMVGEQFYFWSNRKSVVKDVESIDAEL